MAENQSQNQNLKKSPMVIQIPSYQEVLDGTQSKSQQQPSLFAPSETFTQTFASIKNSEFYIPPPAAKTNASSILPSSSGQSGGDLNPAPPSSMGTGSSSSTTFVQKSNAILVSHRQKGNPVLKHIRNVKWNFADVIPDYVLGQNTSALYLSLRYHLLHPDYLYFRIRELQKNFRLRVVLCHVDVEDVVKPLLEVIKTTLLHDCTLLCAWSLEECGRYLETIKVYENKPADIIQGHVDADYSSRLNHALTSIRQVNKIDVVTLGSTFGSLSHIMDASMDDLARCPGIGERKVKRLHDTFHEPFKRVTPIRTTVPETSTQNNLDPNSMASKAPMTEKETEDTRKRQKKSEPELSIKSALSAGISKVPGKAW